MRIGWIGAGIMGRPLIGHLLNQQQEVHVYARRPETIKECLSQGAISEAAIETLVSHVDVVCTMVGFPDDVKAVYRRIFSVIEKGKTCIDFTTSSPALAKKLAQQAEERNVNLLDAPVTGGDAGAKAGTLTILVGGQKEVFEAMLPVLKAFGSQIEYCGTHGSGQYVKIANQIMIANTLQGICEAMVFLKENGISQELIHRFLRNGAAGSKQLDLLGLKMLNGDYNPGFYVKHFVKDLKIAVTECAVSLDGVDRVIKEYVALMDRGYSNQGTQCLIEFFKED